MRKEWQSCSRIEYSRLWGSQRRLSQIGTHALPWHSSENYANNWRLLKTSVPPITHRQMGSRRRRISTLKWHSESTAITSRTTGQNGCPQYNMPQLQDPQQRQRRHHINSGG